jgi:hypothetical protein
MERAGKIYSRGWKEIKLVLKPSQLYEKTFWRDGKALTVGLS